MLALSFSNAFADTTPKLKIKDIKNYLKTINPDTTCMDEYLVRRKQLIVQLSVSPVLMAGATAASGYTAAYTAVAISSAAGMGGWTGVGYAIGGGLVGIAASGAVVAAETTRAALVLSNMTKIVKTLAEQHMNIEGENSEKLYAKFAKRSKSELSQDEFTEKLLAADADGSLCNGSLVEQPRIRLGTKMQFKVAKLKDIVRNF